MAGVRRGTMARYWNGERLFPADLLFRVAAILGVSPQWLLEGNDPKRGKVGANESPDEARLLSAFRRLSPDQQEHVIQNAEMLGTSRTLHSDRIDYRARS
jgi:transcriptional regulator with XRE-family HTH domain